MLTGYHLQPKLWKRFIDDIICIWQHGEEELKKFMDYLNNQHNTIKFTFEANKNEIPFLDTITYRTPDNKLGTKVYHKPTDNKQYLHYTSSHPLKQKNSIPYGLLIRSKRICSDPIDHEKEARDIRNKLLRRGYPRILLDEAQTRISNKSRDELLKPTMRQEKETIKCITTYNPSNPPLNEIVRKHADILEQTRKQNIKKEDIQVIYRRSQNLKDLLVRGKINIEHKQRICQPCGKPRCKTCMKVNTTTTATSSNNISYPIRGTFNCQSHHIIYLMTCNICHIQYVGESSNTLNTRFRGHESAIRTKQLHPVAQHYNTNNHTEEAYTVTVLDKENDKNKRLRLEETWMVLMDTLQPKGLNVRI
jgi:hypothetical protein